jgi:hypothetical protein
MTLATIGWGAKVYLQDGGGVYQQLSEVTAFPFPEDAIADVKATHLLSPNRREEYIAGLIDGGTGDIVMNYVPGSATDALCRDLVASGSTRGFRVQILQPDTTYYEIDVNVIGKQYKRTAPIDNKMDATLTVRFTGASTETDI